MAGTSQAGDIIDEPMARVLFIGSKALGRRVLLHLIDRLAPPHELVGVLSPDDAADPRSDRSSFERIAAVRATPFVTARTRADTIRALSELRADVAVVCGWYVLLPVDRFPETAFYAFHASALPLYRGHAPVVWQIIRGEQRIGLTFFRLTTEMDAGDIAGQRYVPLGPNGTVADALLLLEHAAIELLSECLSPLLDGTIQLSPQDGSQATYCALRTPDDSRIDWTWPARRVHNFVRAQTRPYPGAFAFLPTGQRVRLWRTAITPRAYVGVPGGVAERHADKVTITCGEGAIDVLDAEVDGEALPVAQIFDSLRMRLG